MNYHGSYYDTDTLLYIAKKYEELMNAIHTKNPGESRHEKALRLINEAENRVDDPTGQKDSI